MQHRFFFRSFIGHELLTDFYCSLMTAWGQWDSMLMESQKSPALFLTSSNSFITRCLELWIFYDKIDFYINFLILLLTSSHVNLLEFLLPSSENTSIGCSQKCASRVGLVWWNSYVFVLCFIKVVLLHSSLFSWIKKVKSCYFKITLVKFNSSHLETKAFQANQQGQAS